MGDGGTGLCGGQGGPSRVGEEIENFYRPAGLAYFFGEPVPVGGLLRKKSCVFKAEGLEMER